MKKQYLANCLLLLMLSLSPIDNANRMSLSAEPDPAEIFLPFIGNSMPLAVVHKQNSAFYPGCYLLRGDITSLVDGAFYDVMLEASVYDREGQLLDTTPAYPLMTATLTGQLNPFETAFSTSCDQVEVAYSEVEIKTWSTDSPQVYWPATLVYTSTHESFGCCTSITAEFRNDAGVPMHDVTGVAWSPYQKYSYGNLRHIADVLAPGETVTYTQYLEDVYGSAISTIEVAAQGVIEP